MAIGRVSVEVAPDARGFIQKLRGEILPGADKLGRDIGQHMGDAAGLTARRRIEAQLHDIKAKVNVNADTAKAQAQMAALKEETDSVGDSADRGARRGGLLLKILLAIGPALIPLGAAAAVGFGAIIEGAGVAILAIHGITQNMKDGTTLGKAYSRVLGTLKTDFNKLSTEAARGTFPAFSAAIADINQHMPTLTSQVKLFSGYLGDAVLYVVDGLLNGFEIMQPLVSSILNGVVTLAERFDNFTRGGGLQKFSDTMVSQLPVISAALGDIFTAIGKLLIAGDQIGIQYLNAFAMIARAINALPIGVLEVLLGLFVGFKIAALGWGVAEKAITGVSTAIKGLSAAMAVLRGEEIATAAATAGVNKSLLSLAVLGGPIAAIAALGVALGLLGQKLVTDHPNNPISKAVTGGSGSNLTDKASDASNKALLTKLNKEQATSYTSLSTAVLAAENAQRKANDTLVVGAKASDALSTALTTLNDKYLNVASADTNFWQSLNTLSATLKTNKKAIEGHSDAALADQSALQGVVNAAQQEAIARAKATKNELTGIIALNDSKKAIERKLRSQGLLTDAVQRYINKIFKIPKDAYTLPTFKSQAAENRLARYLTHIGYVPGSKTTTFNAKTGTAMSRLGSLLQYYNALVNKTITVTVNDFHGQGNQPTARKAFGGWVNGPGTSTSDSILTRLSRGEFVVDAENAAKNAMYLESITKSTKGYANHAAAMPPQRAAASYNVTINQVDDPQGTSAAVVRRLDMVGRR